MSAKYCYWSVATGPYGSLMESCVRSARRAAVFKQFHVLTDRSLEGCQCYDAYECEKAYGLFKLHYLKVGMSRLNFDYFIWVDADTVFVRNPVDVLGVLGRSPVHVPLEENLSNLGVDTQWKGTSCFKLRQLFRQSGIANQIYLSQSAFWIVHREAIDTIYDLALKFWNEAKRDGMPLDVSIALGYAMLMLCGDPEAHLLTKNPDLWASDHTGELNHRLPDGAPWTWRGPFGDQEVTIRPAIVHLPSALIRARNLGSSEPLAVEA